MFPSVSSLNRIYNHNHTLNAILIFDVFPTFVSLYKAVLALQIVELYISKKYYMSKIKLPVIKLRSLQVRYNRKIDVEMLVQNQNFTQKLQFKSKIIILLKNGKNYVL